MVLKKRQVHPLVKTTLLISTTCCAVLSLAVTALVTHRRYPWSHILSGSAATKEIALYENRMCTRVVFFFLHAHSQLTSSRNIWAKGE